MKHGDIGFEQRQAQQREGDKHRQNEQRPLGAPFAVEPGDHHRGRQRDEQRIEQQFIGTGYAVSSGAQIGGKPQQQPEIDQSPRRGGEVERYGRRAIPASDQRTALSVPEAPGPAVSAHWRGSN